MHDAVRYGVAFGSFVVLMAGGILVGRWFGSGPALPPPAVVPSPPVAEPGRLRLVIAGNVGFPGATGRHTAEAARRLAAEQGVDAVILIGNLVAPIGADSGEDPRLDELLLDRWGWAPAVHWVFGPRDDAFGADPRRLAFALRWAHDHPPFATRTSSWAFDAGSSLVIAPGSDTTGWADGVARQSSARSRVLVAYALSEAEETRLCGRYQFVVTAASASLGWVERCGTAYISSGTASTADGQAPAQSGALFFDPTPGFVHLDASPDRSTVSFVDAQGRTRFSAVRDRDGSVRTPSGDLLRAAP